LWNALYKRIISTLDICAIDIKRTANGHRTGQKLPHSVTASNLIRAADRLHVSQSKVSTRIHTLEDQLGCTFFVRNKAGTTLTSAGQQFQRHSATLVRTIEQARHDVGIPEEFSGTLIIGRRSGVWEKLLVQWLQLMKEARSEISIRAESGLELELMQGIVGRMDIGVTIPHKVARD
jgi:DNA-binding transcriptional LysR family regulator